MNCAGAREQLGAYVIGALESGTARAVERHLGHCASCQTEAGAYLDAALALPLALPVRAVPSSLRQRVLTAVEDRRAATSHRESMWRWATAAAAAALSLLFAGALAWAIVLQLQLRDLRQEQRALVAQQARIEEHVRQVADAGGRLAAVNEIVSLVFTEGSSHVWMEGEGAAAGAEALYVWHAERPLGVLTSQHLPPPPPGRVYQIWFATESGPVSGGTFTPDEHGIVQLLVRRPTGVGRVRGLFVTLEPAGGSATAGDDLVFGAAPSAAQ